MIFKVAAGNSLANLICQSSKRFIRMTKRIQYVDISIVRFCFKDVLIKNCAVLFSMIFRKE